MHDTNLAIKATSMTHSEQSSLNQEPRLALH